MLSLSSIKSEPWKAIKTKTFEATIPSTVDFAKDKRAEQDWLNFLVIILKLAFQHVDEIEFIDRVHTVYYSRRKLIF